MQKAALLTGAVLGLSWFLAFPSSAGAMTGRQVLRGHVPPAVARLQPVQRLSGTTSLRLAIGLPLRNQGALTNLLQEICDPASPHYRHYLTSAEFAAQFGPTEADYEALKAFALTNGFTITGTHPNRTLLDVSAPVSAIEPAFHLHMQVYRHPKEARTFYAPDAEPSLDTTVPVLSVSGLENFVLPHPMNLIASPITNPTNGATPNGTGSGTGGSYLGGDFRAAYAPGVTLDGTGQTIGLFQLDGYHFSDITKYESLASLPNVPLQNILLDGFDGSAGANNDEVSLDIEMVISMAPGASKVLVYEGVIPNDVLNQIATDNLAKQISSSWAWFGYGDLPLMEQIFQQFAAQGQTYFNASGDSGAYAATDTIYNPSDDPYVTIVGGTTLTTSGPLGNWVSETTWSWFPGQADASSGGISQTYAIPTWQQGLSMTANNGSTTMRNIPDVALTGDNVYVRYNHGSAGIFGGTSCASPLWAGFTALINQQAAAHGKPTVGFINPALYAIGQGAQYSTNFHDITTGNNTNSDSPALFYATNGYDLCTGWGTPMGSNMINSLALGVAPLLVVQPQSQTITVGQNATFNAAAVGSVNLICQWHYNTNTALANATNLSLTLTNVQNTNGGVYSLTVTNAVGGVTSSNAVLTINHPPVAGNHMAGTAQNQSVTLSAAKLLLGDSDPDGDTLSITAVSAASTNNGAVTLSGGAVIYTPPANYTGADLFTYTLGDPYGATATASVVVTIASTNGVSLNIVSPPALANGLFHVKFAGIPHQAYIIDTATNPTGPWQLGYSNLTAGTQGLFDLWATNYPFVPARYFRTRYIAAHK